MLGLIGLIVGIAETGVRALYLVAYVEYIAH